MQTNQGVAWVLSGPQRHLVQLQESEAAEAQPLGLSAHQELQESPMHPLHLGGMQPLQESLMHPLCLCGLQQLWTSQSAARIVQNHLGWRSSQTPAVAAAPLSGRCLHRDLHQEATKENNRTNDHLGT